MQKHTILITEIYESEVEISTSCQTSAIQLANDRWHNREYFLDRACFKKVAFQANFEPKPAA